MSHDPSPLPKDEQHDKYNPLTDPLSAVVENPILLGSCCLVGAIISLAMAIACLVAPSIPDNLRPTAVLFGLIALLCLVGFATAINDLSDELPWTE